MFTFGNLLLALVNYFDIKEIGCPRTVLSGFLSGGKLKLEHLLAAKKWLEDNGYGNYLETPSPVAPAIDTMDPLDIVAEELKFLARYLQNPALSRADKITRLARFIKDIESTKESLMVILGKGQNTKNHSGS